jgi:hypothetical protein
LITERTVWNLSGEDVERQGVEDPAIAVAEDRIAADP